MLPFFHCWFCWMCHCPICSTDEALVYHEALMYHCTTENWITASGPKPWMEWSPGNYYVGPYPVDDQ